MFTDFAGLYSWQRFGRAVENAVIGIAVGFVIAATFPAWVVGIIGVAAMAYIGYEIVSNLVDFAMGKICAGELIDNFIDIGIGLGVGFGAGRLVGKAVGRVGKGKGLQTPEKFFGNKTYKEVEEILTNAFGQPRGEGEYNKSFFNEETKRTYNLHQDPAHRDGRPHIDIRKRNLPTNYYKDRPFFLKDDQWWT